MVSKAPPTALELVKHLPVYSMWHIYMEYESTYIACSAYFRAPINLLQHVYFLGLLFLSFKSSFPLATSINLAPYTVDILKRFLHPPPLQPEWIRILK